MLAPPLIIDDAETDEMLAALEAAVAEVEAEL
jgi:adenosylmethionine-8-amino-7-oxononanoate aminotransferase